MALAVALGAELAAGASELAIGLQDANGATDRIFSVDLESGRLQAARDRRSGEALRLQAVSQNLFDAIGRPLDQPAARGEFQVGEVRDRTGRTRAYFMVETSTGFAGVLTKPGQDERLGELHVLSGRPAESIAAEGGNFLLLMRFEVSRRGASAYLINGTSGQCMRFTGLDDLEGRPEAKTCGSVTPRRWGSSAAIESETGITLSYLVVDDTDGRVYAMAFSGDREDVVNLSQTNLDLSAIFPAIEGASPPRRFLLASVRGESGGTSRVVAIDTATGRLAEIRFAEGATRLSARLWPETLSIGTQWPDASALQILPRYTAGRLTAGLWVFESPRRRVLLIDSPDSDRFVRVVPVEIE